MKIWERYFIGLFFRMFFLFLFCFYGLYIIIDYANHASALASHNGWLPIQEIFTYYFFVFASRAEILLPLALLIAFIHTVCSLNTHRELSALMASGFPLRLLMRPFLVIGVLCIALLYVNEQFFLPGALKKLRRIEGTTKHQRNKQNKQIIVHNLLLEDGSLLIFQKYEPDAERFFDVYWMPSIDNIYRIKYLLPNGQIPIGHFVDHLIRRENGELLQENAYKELPFPEMKFNKELLLSVISDPDLLPLVELGKQSLELPQELNEKESKILTAFYWKMTIPWLCLFAIIIPAPSCIRFSRGLPLFLIYTCSLFGLIAFYLFMDAAQVIAKRQVLSPFIAICIPFIVLGMISSWRFIKSLN